jgi:hypothetical protein
MSVDTIADAPTLLVVLTVSSDANGTVCFRAMSRSASRSSAIDHERAVERRGRDGAAQANRVGGRQIDVGERTFVERVELVGPDRQIQNVGSPPSTFFPTVDQRCRLADRR